MGFNSVFKGLNYPPVWPMQISPVASEKKKNLREGNKYGNFRH